MVNLEYFQKKTAEFFTVNTKVEQKGLSEKGVALQKLINEKFGGYVDAMLTLTSKIIGEELIIAESGDAKPVAGAILVVDDWSDDPFLIVSAARIITTDSSGNIDRYDMREYPIEDFRAATDEEMTALLSKLGDKAEILNYLF